MQFSKILISLTSLLIFKGGFSQEKELLYENAVYENNIKTVQVYKDNLEDSFPIFYLGLLGNLNIEFDEIGDNVSDISFSFEHCTPEWESSELMPIQFLNVPPYFNFSTYEYSAGTIVPYVHFYYVLKNVGTVFTKSGNYLLKVYRNNDEEDLLFTRRIIIAEQKIGIETETKMSNMPKKRKTQQIINFNILPNALPIYNAISELKVFMLRNQNWQTIKKAQEPNFFQPDKLIYSYQDVNTWDGNYEFRNIDFRTVNFFTPNVKKIEQDNEGTYVYTFAELPRKYVNYQAWNDLNGQFFVNVEEFTNSDTDADYATVSFQFDVKGTPINSGSIHVVGGFNNFKINENSKMEYNQSNGTYEAEILLKQGVYDYKYVVKTNDGKIDETVFDGNYRQTQNDYYIFVYYRYPGEIYYRAVGFKKVNFSIF